MTTQSLAKAAQFAPVVERVHGANHPELTRVKELTLALHEGGNDADALFTELRQVTNNYALPEDACEAYTWTYEALKSADEAHTARAV